MKLFLVELLPDVLIVNMVLKKLGIGFVVENSVFIACTVLFVNSRLLSVAEKSVMILQIIWMVSTNLNVNQCVNLKRFSMRRSNRETYIILMINMMKYVISSTCEIKKIKITSICYVLSA